MEDFLAFAGRLADAAREETLKRWRTPLVADNKAKSGFDPVTDADREAERAMRALIERHFPDHGIQGEEFPDRPGAGRYGWSLDPVDGTRAFVCGLPSWTTLIALLDEGQPILGLIDAPAMGERYAMDGATSGCARLAEARFSTTDPFLFDEDEAPRVARVRRAARTARYGLDGYGYAMVAAGHLDLVIESGLKPHDYNALIPVVRAAGGWIGDWRGGEDFAPGRVVAAASRALYDEAVARLA
ncbi:MAG: inositol monophosphatase family protein [Allosphingosinicella sp.]